MRVLTRDDTEYDEEYVLHSEALEELAALRAETERCNRQLLDLQAKIASLKERCARSRIDSRRAERERLRGHFRDALADTGIVWPGEVDILYDTCFGVPYVPFEAD